MRKWVVIGVAGALLACDVELEKDKYLPEKRMVSLPVDLSSVLYLGDEFMAGYTDGELFVSGQRFGVASILGKQFTTVGAPEVRTPFMLDEYGFGGRLQLGLYADCTDEKFLAPVPVNADPNPGNSNDINDLGPFNNLSFPGCRISDIDDPELDQRNPYFARMNGHAGTPLQELIAPGQHTFFVAWLGMADFMQYLLGGADITSPIDDSDLTELEIFADRYDQLLANLTDQGATGVILNLPDPFQLPVFNLIPYDTLTLTQNQADQLNAIYALNPNVRFKEGENAFVIENFPFPRHLKEGEKVIFSLNLLDRIKCDQYGSFKPMGDEDVLTLNEIGEVRKRINSFNHQIRLLAQRYGLVHIDIAQVMQDLYDNGHFANGVQLDRRFGLGGLYSLDGFSLTGRHYALIVNNIIERLNEEWGSNLPVTNVLDYPGSVLPED